MNELLDYALQLQAESAGRALDGDQDQEIKAGLILAQYESAREKDPAPK